MNTAILICTYGDPAWEELAMSRAHPSTIGQGALEVICHHEDSGTLASARNAAVQATDADWLAFLDSDDELAPGYLQAMMSGAHDVGLWLPEDWERSPALLAPALQRIEHGRASRPAIPNAGKWPATNECVIGTLVPRELFLQVGGFRERAADGTPLTMYEDWDAFLRMYDAGARLVHVPGAVYREHVSGGRNARPEWRPVYDAIWRDHLERVKVPA